ncbi:MAG: hypothetical protein IKD08_01470 [Alphaproteobacteria bacterium]|nr:hypothetical protein [Alphaproteobacteria bacterium]
MDALSQGPEQQIIDAVERLLKSPDNFYAVRIFVSRLLPIHQNDNKIAVILHILGENNYLYKLSNQDVILIIRNVKKDHLEELLDSIRALFPRDPAILQHPPEYFIHSYNLRTEYRLFVAEIDKMAGKDVPSLANNAINKTPLTPENLEGEEQRAKLSNLADAVRRQAVVTVSSDKKIKVLFYELFTSTALLGQRAIPNVNLLSDAWLFQHLTETLDLKVIEAVQVSNMTFVPPVISLNLNISTVFTPMFAEFSQAMKEKGVTLIAEIQVRDIFSNAAEYAKAKDLLHQSGHKVLLDGISHNSLLFLDVMSFEPDLIKIIWSSQLEDAYDIEVVQQIQEKGGKNKIILCRCDDEKALMWGMTNKVMFFQGYFVDKMVSALAKSLCKDFGCPLADCIENHKVISDTLRRKCPNIKMIDNPPFGTAKIWEDENAEN